MPNHGSLRVGDALTEGEDLRFTGIPNFAPEILRRIRLDEPMRAKQLHHALEEIGRGRRHPSIPSHPGLELDRRRGRAVAARRAAGAARRRNTASTCCGTPREFALARWISSDDPKALAQFIDANGLGIADDLDGDPVFLARNQFYLDYTRERAPGIAFADVKDRHANGAAA